MGIDSVGSTGESTLSLSLDIERGGKVLVMNGCVLTAVVVTRGN